MPTRRPTTGLARRVVVRPTMLAERGCSPRCNCSSGSPNCRCATPTGAWRSASEHGLVDFDLAYAHEARARALKALGDDIEAAAELGNGQGGADRRCRRTRRSSTPIWPSARNAVDRSAERPRVD